MSGRTWTSTIFCLLALLLAWGCSEEGGLDPNLPPETTLFIDDGSQLATHYRQILFWHGEDLDGEVARFEYKWTFSEGVQTGDFDTTWVGLVEPFVTATSDTFFLPLPTPWSDTRTANFAIRAVDAQGLADPDPAEADFSFYNQAPRLYAKVGEDTTLTLTLPAEILPVYNLEFKVLDPDNPPTDDDPGVDYIDEIRFWFEDPEAYISLSGADTLLILDADDFGDGIGQTREFHLQAIDMAGALSNVLAASAFVRDVSEAKVLILDSADPFSTTVTVVDAFWHDEVASLFASEEVFIHDFAADGRLGHPSILYSIFSLFEAVIWYNGAAGMANDWDVIDQYYSLPTPEIAAAEGGLREYVEQGGHVLLSGYNLIGASVGEVAGACFSPEFEWDVLFVDSLYVHSTKLPPDTETSPNYRLYPGREILGFEDEGSNTLRNMSAVVGIDLMYLNTAAKANGLIDKLHEVRNTEVYPNIPIPDPPEVFEGAVGVRRNYESGGELILLTFPISLAYGYDNELDEVMRFLQDFGVLP